MANLIRPDLIKSNYGAASNLAHNEKVKTLIRQGQPICHFGFGQSPFPPMEIAEQSLRENAHQTAYLASQGILSLRQGIASFHQRHDNVTVDPDDVIVGPGSKELILHLLLIFNGDIIVNAPSWTTYKPQAILAGHTPITVDSKEADDWKLTPCGIEQALAGKDTSDYKILIFTNPCNPTGTGYSEQELKMLTKTFRVHKILVICDEIYARLRYDGNHQCLMKFYPEGTILSTGFSKWASAGGYRMGYHIYPKELRHLLATMISVASHSFSCAPAPMQFAFAQALQEHTACDDYIQHTTRILSLVGAFSARTLRSVGVSVVEPTAGYYIFPNFNIIRPALVAKGVHTCQHMCDLLLSECKVAVLPGGPAHLRPIDELTVRLCYICFDGKKALDESRRLGMHQPLNDNFVHEFCRPVYDGILILKNWVQTLKESTDHITTSTKTTMELAISTVSTPTA